MRPREVVAWTVAVIALGVAAIGTFLLTRANQAAVPITRFTMSAPPNTTFTSNTILDVSPDGRYIVFLAGASNEPSHLWLRSLDATEAVQLAGTAGAGVPFWSPDSRFIGFFADNKLKKVAIGGGPPVVLTDATVAGANRGGGAWSQDDVIVFQPANEGPLVRVAAAGGVPTPATKLDETRKDIAHRYPTFLPDGKHFLYVAQPGGWIVAASLDSAEVKPLFQADSKPVFAEPEQLLFVRDNVLMAQRFDTKRLEVVGEAVPVGQQVRTNRAFGSAAFSASDSGVLAYGIGAPSVGGRLDWVDATGRASPAVEGTFDYRSVELSPDDAQVIVHRHEEEGGGGLWLTDLARGATTRFTVTPTHDANALYSPDRSLVAFGSTRDEREAIFVRPGNGVGDDKLLFKAPYPARPSDWSRDGRWIAYTLLTPKGDDVWLLPHGREDKPVAVANTDFNEGAAQFSPDGRYIAYISNATRRPEIYLQSLAPGGGKWQVSTNGAVYPRWRGDSAELYYLSLSGLTMMAVSMELGGASPVIGNPRPLFDSRAAITTGGFPYAVTKDGKRFLIARTPEVSPTVVTVVLNWVAALPQR